MDKIRIFLIGAGRSGETHGDVYFNYIPSVKVAAVFDTDILKAKNLAVKYNLDEKFAFDNIENAFSCCEYDATVITTPTFTHCAYTEISARKKLHVFCEKPMAVTSEDCDKMIDICKKEKVKFQIGFMRRFDAGFMGAKKIIESGEIGDILIIKSLGRGPGLPGKWALDIKNSNGNLAEVNSHDFDSIRWLSASDYKRIYAVAKNSKNPEIGKEYPLFYDTAMVSATMNNDIFGMIDGVCPCDYGYDARVEVVGSKGVLFIGSLEDNSTITCTKEKGLVSPQFSGWRKRFHNAYITEDNHFIDCIVNDRNPSVDGIDGKKAVIAVIAANESLQSHLPVDL